MRLMHFQTPQELRQQLLESGINTDGWENSEQAILELWQEIQHSDCHLVQDDQGQIMRRVRIVAVVLGFQDKILVEHTQSRNSGKEVRHRQIAGSLIETLLAGESPEEGALRVLAEEMDLHAHAHDLSVFEQGITSGSSLSYPGLFSEYHIYRTRVEMPVALYQQEYQVEFDGWATTWTWASEEQSAQFFQKIN